jgi:chorismate mutase
VKVYVPLFALSTTAGDHEPVMELLEAVGNEGTMPPEQMLKVVPKVKVGVVCGVIVTVNVVVVAHCPASGVKVYVPLFALSTTAGDHEPVMELLEEVGNEGTIPPEQMLKVVPKVKVGVVCGVTVTVNVIVVAHCPASGVKVYVPLFALSTIAGDQVPVMELLEEVGKAGTVPPEQILKVVPKVNVGVICGVIVTVNVVELAHCPVLGVKV